MIKSRSISLGIFVVIVLICNILLSQTKHPPKRIKRSKSTSAKQVQKNTPSIVYDEIDIGHLDTAIIGKPTKVDFFEHLDMFRKTRWDSDVPGYDTATGNGFYGSFFKGDFDVSELPASYKGEKFVILGVEMLKNKNTGQDMNIMYLYSDMQNAVIWVDFDKAVESGEIKFIPRKIKK